MLSIVLLTPSPLLPPGLPVILGFVCRMSYEVCIVRQNFITLQVYVLWVPDVAMDSCKEHRAEKTWELEWGGWVGFPW